MLVLDQLLISHNAVICINTTKIENLIQTKLITSSRSPTYQFIYQGLFINDFFIMGMFFIVCFGIHLFQTNLFSTIFRLKIFLDNIKIKRNM